MDVQTGRGRFISKTYGYGFKAGRSFCKAFAEFQSNGSAFWSSVWSWLSPDRVFQGEECQKVQTRSGVWQRKMECIILSVKEAYMDAQEVMHMTDYSKITALYSRLSVGDEDRDGGESNSI